MSDPEGRSEPPDSSRKWTRAQQESRRFEGRLALVGGNFADLIYGTQAASRALRTANELHWADIVNYADRDNAKLVVIRPLVVAASDRTVEKGAELLRAAIHSSYDVPIYLIPKPVVIGAEDHDSVHLAEQLPQAIDSAIDDLDSRTSYGRNGATTLGSRPDVSLVLVARTSTVNDALPSPVKRSIYVGGAAVLKEVGKTPQENLWIPGHMLT